MGRKNCKVKEIFDRKSLRSKKFWPKEIWGPKNVDPRKFWVKNIGSMKIWAQKKKLLQKIWVQEKILGTKKCWVKKKIIGRFLVCSVIVDLIIYLFRTYICSSL